MSRVGRDSEHRAAVRKRLTHASIRMMTIADGVVTPLTDGIRAVIDSAYLDDLKTAVRRGMAGVVRDGRNAGGRAYGYRPVPGRPGELAIAPAEADVVRRVYADYLGGATSREIVTALNADGVAPPRGRFWRASALLGNPRRHCGILQNEIYVGRIVWNRVRMVRDPDTERRVSRINPESEWQRADAPHLAILDAATFDAAQARRAARTRAQPRDRQRPRYPLSGLLRCGCCGAGMSIKDRQNGRRRIVCSQMKEAGACDHRRPYLLDAIEEAVIGALRDKLGSRDAIAWYVRVYNDEQRRHADDSVRQRARLERDVARTQGELDRTIDALIKGRLSDAEADTRLPELRAARDAATAALAASAEPPRVVTLHPAAVDAYLKNLDRLADLIGDDLQRGDAELANALRSLIETVTVTPTLDRGKPQITIAGHLASLIDRDAFPQGSIRGGRLVAEEGFEPPTHGL